MTAFLTAPFLHLSTTVHLDLVSTALQIVSAASVLTQTTVFPVRFHFSCTKALVIRPVLLAFSTVPHTDVNHVLWNVPVVPLQPWIVPLVTFRTIFKWKIIQVAALDNVLKDITWIPQWNYV